MTHSDWILEFVRLVEVEQLAADLEILEVGLVEESELVDPEETLRHGKLALSSEIVVDSELPGAEYSTSIVGFDDLTFRRPDNRPSIIHFCLCDPFDHFDCDSNPIPTLIP